jgi:multidrug resistance efflux pump
VGDHVKKGDVICTLDTTDLDKQIADKKTALADAAAQLKDDYQKLQNQLDRAKTEKANVQKTQDALVAAAQSARDAAKNDLASLQSGYNAAKSQYDTMMQVVQPYIDALNAASAKRQTAYDAWIAAGGAAATADPSGSAAPTAYDVYQSALQAEQAAQAALDSAKTLYSFGTYNDAMTAAQSGYDAKKAALDTAQAALDAAANARQTALNEQDNTISDLAAQTTASYNKMQKGTSDSDLSDLQKKKDDAVLKAESDGEVTELNVTVGSIPKDAVAKIQSTTDLVLRVSIPEADINRVSPGLAARITADSIQTPASGTLTTVSATADSSAASAGKSYDHRRAGKAKAKAELEILHGIDGSTVYHRRVRQRHRGVLNPASAGKSTLMNIIGRAGPAKTYGRPNELEITAYLTVDGVAIGRQRKVLMNSASGADAMSSPIRNRKIGFVFPELQSDRPHHALQNVELPMLYAGISRRASGSSGRKSCSKWWAWPTA